MVSLKILQNSQESTCDKFSFLIKLQEAQFLRIVISKYNTLDDNELPSN